MTTLRFSESHSEVFEADGADLTTQIPRQFTAGLHLQVSFTISYISAGLLTSFELVDAVYCIIGQFYWQQPGDTPRLSTNQYAWPPDSGPPIYSTSIAL